MMHEFSHSTLAWLLGAKADPLNIIYGDLIGSGWDENVDYGALFHAGPGHTAAAIAFAGPFSNIALFFVTAGLMATRWVKEHRWAYHTTFWTSVITFIMIFEYVLTRSFMTHDDFGNINHGLGDLTVADLHHRHNPRTYRVILPVCVQTAGVFRHHDH